MKAKPFLKIVFSIFVLFADLAANAAAPGIKLTVPNKIRINEGDSRQVPIVAVVAKKKRVFVNGLEVTMKILDSNKDVVDELTGLTNIKGKVLIKIPRDLDAGTYSIEISAANAGLKRSTLTIRPSKTKTPYLARADKPQFSADGKTVTFTATATSLPEGAFVLKFGMGLGDWLVKIMYDSLTDFRWNVLYNAAYVVSRETAPCTVINEDKVSCTYFMDAKDDDIYSPANTVFWVDDLKVVK